MSSAVVSTSAALGRLFLFDADADPEVGSGSAATPNGRALLDRTAESGCAHKVFQSTINNQQSKILASSIAPASRLAVRPVPEMAPSGIAAIDALSGGLPRGCLTEICGPDSSGRTTVLLAALAAASQRGEYCAVIDASDALDPHSLNGAGVDLDHLLWVRCGEEFPQKKNSPQRHGGTESFSNNSRIEPKTAKYQSEQRLEQVLRVTDLLLESGGFGLIILDLADISSLSARRIPLTTWFRFRRAVEHKPTILLAIEPQPIAGSCSSLLLQLGIASSQCSVLSSNRTFVDAERDTQNVQPAYTELFTGLEINAELIRSRLDRKPSRSVTFETKTAWAG